MNKKVIQIKEIVRSQPHEISKPQFPDVRIKTKFLFFPKTINGKTKWLTKSSWQEEFKQEIDYDALNLGSNNCLIWTWKPIKWI